MRLTLALLLLTVSLFAVEIDPSAKSFEQRQQKYQVEVYDFVGLYPNLEHIDIDAKRKKRVEFNMKGSYPVLQDIVYEGGFGTLKGELTGEFPALQTASFLCGNTAMTFNLKGNWSQSCLFTFRGMKEPLTLQIPDHVGVIAHVNTKIGAKISPGPLKKKGWWKLSHRTYQNELAEAAPVVLTFYIDVADAPVTFE